MNTPRILVCGNREWACRRTIEEYLPSALFLARQRCERPIFGADAILIHGDAPGADRIAAAIAHEYGWRVETYSANWDRDGKAAGPIRNQKMLDAGTPHVCIAFGALERRGKRTGTNDMVERSIRAGVPTIIISRCEHVA